MSCPVRECSRRITRHGAPTCRLRCVLALVAVLLAGSPSPLTPAASKLTSTRLRIRYGKWELIGQSGVPAMHAALMANGKVVFLDKAEPWTYAVLPDGNYTFSTEFNPDTGKATPLTVRTNTFCSAGGFLADGTLINVGGAEQFRMASEGFNVIRSLKPCRNLQKRHAHHLLERMLVKWNLHQPQPLPSAECDWRADGNISLADYRWYPTVATLEDGRIIVVGGSNKSVGINRDDINVPTYEFYPRKPGSGSFYLPFLVDTMPFNLYPGVHLLPNGRLFIWASNKAMEFDYNMNTVVKTYPDIPGPPRSYPLTGTSVLLPLDPRNKYKPEVIVFGGSEKMYPTAWIASLGVDSLARIDLSQKDAKWKTEIMPLRRVMPDGVILADGTVFISNGAERGVAGYNVSTNLKASDPVQVPVIYYPHRPRGKRFRKMAKSKVPRLYHSVSLLLPDGRVLVAGSNPIDKPTEKPPASLRWGTEFRVEAFYPPYLFTGRPRIEVVNAPGRVRFGKRFSVVINSRRNRKSVVAALVHTGFVTHSTHMSQRYVRLSRARTPRRSESTRLFYKAPPNGAVAPPGPYMLFLLEDGVPCIRAPFLLVDP